MARLFVSLVLASMILATASIQAKDVRMKAEDPAPPAAVARYLMGTRLGYITCSGKYRAYLEKRDLYEVVTRAGTSQPRGMETPSSEDATACVHETVDKAKSLHDGASRHATSEPARTALHEYATAWEASLTALASREPEKPREFDARMKKQEARLDELQKRVEATAR